MPVEQTYIEDDGTVEPFSCSDIVGANHLGFPDVWTYITNQGMSASEETEIWFHANNDCPVCGTKAGEPKGNKQCQPE